jgi:hypothetical protein
MAADRMASISRDAALNGRACPRPYQALTHEPQERGAGHDDTTSDLDARKLAATQGLVASAREMPSMVAAVSTP